ncbi:hypothetical protein N0V82_007606 [Gnomoniopsis sp. IMI 355080]|nr:hypothetical protein N0V82_007606 [Gnomoniopsis sp. IMI 355080]
MSSSRTSSSRHHSGSSSAESTIWQDKLDGACREYGMTTPVFQIVSDRRGGRTAWSSRVVVSGQTVAARFWYDGKNLNNAKEDAAEMALGWIQASAAASTAGSSPSSSRNSGW